MGLLELFAQRRQQRVHDEALEALDALIVLCRMMNVDFAEQTKATPASNAMFVSRLVNAQKIMNRLLARHRSRYLQQRVHDDVMTRFSQSGDMLNGILESKGLITADDNDLHRLLALISVKATIIQGVLCDDPDFVHSAKS